MGFSLLIKKMFFKRILPPKKSRPFGEQIANGLHILLDETRKSVDIYPKKVEAMQGIYLAKNRSLYTDEESQQLQYYLKACNYKFYLATLNLEQLWSLSDTKPIFRTFPIE